MSVGAVWPLKLLPAGLLRGGFLRLCAPPLLTGRLAPGSGTVRKGTAFRPKCCPSRVSRLMAAEENPISCKEKMQSANKRCCSRREPAGLQDISLSRRQPARRRPPESSSIGQMAPQFVSFQADAIERYGSRKRPLIRHRERSVDRQGVWEGLLSANGAPYASAEKAQASGAEFYQSKNSIRRPELEGLAATAFLRWRQESRRRKSRTA